MLDRIMYFLQFFAGSMFVTFGANNLLGFIPMQPGTESMGIYLAILAQAGALMSIVSSILMIAGLSFIINRFELLSSFIMIPIMGNAFSAHLFFKDYAGIVPSLFCLFVCGLILYRNRLSLKPLLAA